MSQTAKVHEPSMEEILASIRRIIADDDNAKEAPAPEKAASRQPQASPRASAAPMQLRPVAPPAGNSSQTKIDAILAELDGPLKSASSPAAPAAEDSESVEAMEPPPAPVPAPTAHFQSCDPESDVVFAERPYQPPEEPAMRNGDDSRSQFSQSPAPDRGLISASTIAAMDNAFSSLESTTVIGQNSRTLEDMVKEMLRPMLKGWLDENLPNLVERIVRAEIERVSRGRS
jgi:hypothetical protein